MKSYFRALLCALLVSMPTVNASVAFKESLVTPEGDIRLVFTLEKVALLNAYALDDPSRIVIDIKDVAMGEIKSTKLGPVQSIRGIQESNLTRLVIDLNGSVYWKKPWQVKKKEEVLLILEMKNNQTTSRNTRDILVAIDAGHGGKDPGAVGKNILEKDVTRMIAKELERTLRDTKGYQPIMIRKGDTFVNLDDRYQIAREQGADLFVSIHADGFRLSSVKGASVFVWSEEASSITADNLSKKVLATDPAVKAKIGKLDV
jgi:N-acetylmuramoyl-L-alanine amidase